MIISQLETDKNPYNLKSECWLICKTRNMLAEKHACCFDKPWDLYILVSMILAFEIFKIVNTDINLTI
jgi:hypothetical protein